MSSVAARPTIVFNPKLPSMSVCTLSVTTHVAANPHPPPSQPVNVELAAGVAVSTTPVPAGNDCEQLPGQLIPGGTLVTVPAPEPPRVRESIVATGLLEGVTGLDATDST